MVGYALAMNITLCIETSSAHCSVALAVGDELFDDNRLLERSHNEHLLAMLDALCGRANIRAADVELIGFGCGPGSFTGVRIAASVSQAIALAAGCPVVPIPSSQVLADTAQAETGLTTWVSCIRSRGTSYYLALYENEKKNETAPGHNRCTQAEMLCQSPPEWLRSVLDAGESQAPDVVGGVVAGIVGEMPPWLPECGLTHITLPPSAKVMVARTRAYHAQGSSVDAELALPVYVQGDSPWVKLSGKRKQAV